MRIDGLTLDANAWQAVYSRSALLLGVMCLGVTAGATIGYQALDSACLSWYGPIQASSAEMPACAKPLGYLKAINIFTSVGAVVGLTTGSYVHWCRVDWSAYWQAEQAANNREDPLDE